MYKKYEYLQTLFEEYRNLNNQESFNLLYKQTYNIQLKLAIGYCGDKRLAEEAVNSMFVSLVANKHKIVNSRGLIQWMNTTTINFCNRLLSKQTYEISNTVSCDDQYREIADKSFEIIRNSNTLKDIIYASLEHLDPAIKEIVILRYLDEYSINEIAEMKHVNRKTITRKLNAAFLFLKDYIVNNYGSLDNILF